MDLFERPRVLKHQVVRSRLEGLLEDLVEGDPFPAERALAEAFSVSRETIRQALRELLLDGRIITTAGVRIGLDTTRLPAHRYPDLEPNFEVSSSLYAEFARRGINFGRTEDTMETTLPDAREAALLHVDAYADVRAEAPVVRRPGRSHRIPPLTPSRRPDGVQPDDAPRLTVSRSVPARYTGRSRCLRCRREPTTRARTHRSVAGHPR